MLLLVSLVFSTAVAGASPAPFSENFNGTSLDTTKWIVEENVNGGSGGTITVADSYVYLTSNGTSSPLVYTATNPFPTSGDFAVEFDIKYTRVSGWGTGFWITEGFFEPTESGRGANIMQVWADFNGPGPHVDAYLLGKQVFQGSVQKNAFNEYESDTFTFRLQCSGDVYTLFLDGEELSSAQSTLRADTIGFGHPPIYYVPWSFSSQWSSFKIDSIRLLEPSVLSISTNPSSALDFGFKVGISGRLTDRNGTALSSAPVLLSYQIPGTSTWNPVASASTDTNGAYAITWLAPATGNFILKTEWAGDSTYAGAFAYKNVSVTDGHGEALFLAESNSTLSSLVFNSTSKEIGFTASGPSGTTGYVRFMILKNVMENITEFKVFLDGKQVQFTVTSEGEMYVLDFHYSHSSHSILIKMLSSAATNSPEQQPELQIEPEPQQVEPFPTTLVIASVVSVAGFIMGLLVYFKKCKH